MTLHIYNTTTDPEHAIKDLSNVVSPAGGYQGNVRDAVSIDRPVIMVQATITTGNYAYIPDFGRYYWILEKTVVRTGLTQLILQSDPLHSFYAQYAALPLYVTRCEQTANENNPHGYNTYIRDSTIQKTAREFTIVKNDPNFSKFEYPDNPGQNVYQYILGVIG